MARFRYTRRGFTLIELMITVAIVALLATVAYPSYVAQARKARRADAKQALLDLAARQERFNTVNNRWASTPGELGYGTATFPLDIHSGAGVSYRMDLQVDATTGSYTATATATDRQAGDGCGNYTLDHQGRQASSGSAANCW